jgi:hypothetical protein
MKLSLTDIATEEDRQRALAMLVALEPVMRSNVAPTPVVVEMPVAEAPAKKTRRAQKANGAAEPTPAEPVAEPVEPEPVAEPDPVAEPVPATAPVAKPESVEPVAEHVPATAPAPEADDEAVREELRQVARTKGVVWLREILASYQAARLGDLTIAQVQEALHAAAQ